MITLTKDQMAETERVISELMGIHGIEEGDLQQANPITFNLLLPKTLGISLLTKFGNDLFHRLGILSNGINLKLNEWSDYGNFYDAGECYCVMFNHPVALRLTPGKDGYDMTCKGALEAASDKNPIEKPAQKSNGHRLPNAIAKFDVKNPMPRFLDLWAYHELMMHRLTRDESVKTFCELNQVVNLAVGSRNNCDWELAVKFRREVGKISPLGDKERSWLEKHFGMLLEYDKTDQYQEGGGYIYYRMKPPADVRFDELYPDFPSEHYWTGGNWSD